MRRYPIAFPEQSLRESAISRNTSRFPLNYSEEFALDLGFKNSHIDDILLFHLVWKNSSDLSLNAIAN